jgi:hypothetical protein
MLKGALVGAVALTTGMMTLAPVPAHSEETWAASYERPVQSGPVVKEAHIARLKSALNLQPHQQQYWAPVESALRALAREQRAEGSNGFVQRMSDRAVNVAGTAINLRRLSAAAGPLIASLDETQKQHGMALVRRFGFAGLLASY